MAVPGFLTIVILTGLQAGSTMDVPISEAESAVMMGTAKLATPGEPPSDPDAVFTPGPTLDH